MDDIFKNVRHGDKLYSLELGECSVYLVVDKFTYPVHVTNGDRCLSYTYSGLLHEKSVTRSLYYVRPTILITEEEIRKRFNDKVIEDNAQ